ncbi:MAG: DUF4430 domain-containing protein [Firmicutes bacterium]|nr:DUF4430 domain-containing protein [Bacillota bacterium]
MKKGPRGKHNFIWAGISLALLIAFGGILAFSLTSQVEAIPENPLDGINAKRSQELVTGSGFQMDKKQEQTRKKEEKKKQQEQKKEKTVKKQEPGTAPVKAKEDALPQQRPGGKKPSDGGQQGGEAQRPQEDQKDPPEEQEDPLLPTIATNLRQKEEVAIGYKGFWIKAADHKNRAIDSSGIEVSVNGEKVYRSGEDGSKVNYGAEMIRGENSIRITATDRYGKSKTILYLIYGTEGKEEEKEGAITLSIEAGTIGKGYILGPMEAEVAAGKPFAYTLDNALKEKGFSYDSGGSLNTGFYLKRIYKTGITSGYKLPSALEQILEEDIGYTKTNIEANSLGEKDFTTESGWMYQVNGEGLSHGVSGYIPRDGDTVRIRFTLWQGKDLNGEWGSW